MKSVILMAIGCMVLMGCAVFKQKENEATILFIGQSNMAGRVDVKEEAFPGDTPLYLLDNKKVWQELSSSDVDINIYSNLEPANTSPKFGISFGFIYELLESQKFSSLYLVSNSRGGTAIECWITGNCIQETLSRVDGINIDFVVFHQGENDWFIKNKKYHENVIEFANLVFEKIAPKYLIVGGIGACNGIDVSYENESWRKLADIDDRIGFASSSDLTCFDHAHFDRASIKELGKRYYKELKLDVNP